MPRSEGLRPHYTVTIELSTRSAWNDLYVTVTERRGRSRPVTTYEDVLRTYRVAADLPVTAANISNIVREALLENSGAGAVQLREGDAS